MDRLLLSLNSCDLITGVVGAIGSAASGEVVGRASGEATGNTEDDISLMRFILNTMGFFNWRPIVLDF